MVGSVIAVRRSAAVLGVVNITGGVADQVALQFTYLVISVTLGEIAHCLRGKLGIGQLIIVQVVLPFAAILVLSKTWKYSTT